ncbi:hypothetical protein AIT88_004076, partial [Salmonella enterica subsp. houtenae]
PRANEKQWLNPTQQMLIDYLSAAIVLHSHSPPTPTAVKHNSPVVGSYFNDVPDITWACVTVPPNTQKVTV